MTLGKIKTITIFIFLTIFTFIILSNSSLVIQSTLTGINIWKDAVFPSLFTFFVLADLLIYYGYANMLGILFQPFMRFFFRLGGNSAFVFMTSMISGFPSGAKYTRQMLTNNLITTEEANHLIMISHFSNPLFIFGAISSAFLKKPELGIYILSVHFLGNIIIGIAARFRLKKHEITTTHSIRNAFAKMHQTRIKKEVKFGAILNAVITNAMSMLLLILGIIILFLIITNLFQNYFPMPQNIKATMSGILEMSQGLNNLQYIDLPLKNKTMLALIFISFGGLSVHTQVLAIISGTGIRYTPFFVARVIHAVLSAVIVYFTFNLFY